MAADFLEVFLAADFLGAAFLGDFLAVAFLGADFGAGVEVLGFVAIVQTPSQIAGMPRGVTASLPASTKSKAVRNRTNLFRTFKLQSPFEPKIFTT